ncbi:MAG: DNA mismatch repair endonuclease MutL, partial [Oscillospiraceae bacterium]|nr:DNA mismatch repair endonuclease MutL [Oscillospiraceae bacterium]
MPEIRQLDRHTAELIAAGEVVERPSSVAKELLENAIDAGASAVVVELEQGGLTYLRITDNGCGMTPEQLPVAFLRHATSKLRTAEDLAAIGTLGFRGEALAAISAVSRVDVYSRTPGAPEGAMLHLEGGVPGQVEAAGCPEGTTICVRDLFYNTPARMKFMKKDTAEATAVANVVTHLALSHPDISFKLLRDGQEALHTPGDGQLLSAVYAALGRDFAKSLLPIHGSGGDVSADGFITAPLAGHGTRARQIFFVNGRLVKSQLLQAALEEGYRNRLLKGKFPGCVIHVTLPHDMVDVNVHPAKTVVKFAAEKAVFDAVYYTVKDALDAENRPAAPAPQREFYRTMTAEEYRAAAAEQAKKPLGSYGAKSAALPLHDVAPTPGQPFTAPAPQGRQYVITPPPAEKSAQPSPTGGRWPEGPDE